MKRWIVIMPFLLLSCQIEDNRIETLLANLKASSTETFDDHYEKLEAYMENHITLGNIEKILQSLSEAYPKRKYEFEDTQTDLIRLILGYQKVDVVPLLAEVWPSVTKSAKEAIVFSLTYIPHREAVDLAFQILKESATDPLDSLIIDGWEENPEMADLVFPALLDYLRIEHYRHSILYLLFHYLDKDSLTQERLKDNIDGLVKTFDTVQSSIDELTLDRTRKNWFYEENYAGLRGEKALLLDIFGFLTDDRIDNRLEKNLASPDPRMQYFSLKSLYRKRKTLNEAIFKSIAKDNEMRKWLFEFAQENNLLSRINEPNFTQEKLAESDMVNWLIYPTELGAAPDQIELKEIITMGDESEIQDFYLFRYKVNPPHWAAEDGWMAGLSGYYIRSEAPTVNPYGYTFSTFTKWDEKTPKEHFEEITGLIEKHYSER